MIVLLSSHPSKYGVGSLLLNFDDLVGIGAVQLSWVCFCYSYQVIINSHFTLFYELKSNVIFKKTKNKLLSNSYALNSIKPNTFNRSESVIARFVFLIFIFYSKNNIHFKKYYK